MSHGGCVKVLMIYLTFFTHTKALKSKVYLIKRFNSAVFLVLNNTYGQWPQYWTGHEIPRRRYSGPVAKPSATKAPLLVPCSQQTWVSVMLCG